MPIRWSSTRSTTILLPTSIPGDWIEFYNPHTYPLDISNWTFKDENDLHAFNFPAGTVVPSQGYIVLAENTNSFDSLFPLVTNDLGPIGFGFSGNGELLRLYNERRDDGGYGPL